MEEDSLEALVAVHRMQISHHNGPSFLDLKVDFYGSDGVETAEVLLQELPPAGHHGHVLLAEFHVLADLCQQQMPVVVPALLAQMFQVGEGAVQLIIEFGGHPQRNE